MRNRAKGSEDVEALARVTHRMGTMVEINVESVGTSSLKVRVSV